MKYTVFCLDSKYTDLSMKDITIEHGEFVEHRDEPKVLELDTGFDSFKYDSISYNVLYSVELSKDAAFNFYRCDITGDEAKEENVLFVTKDN